tara:strand:- start:3584 stop:3979 length:396 start_codon:yes stop_codon:yes gene_type:complete
MSRKQKRFNVHKRATRLRKRGTKWEQFVLVALRRNHINCLFQYVYKPYIVDFLLFDRDVILEIEGKQHANRVTYDERRTAFLEETTGCKVVRWKNTEVTRRLPALITQLRAEFPVANNHPPDTTYGYGLFG